MADDSDIVIDKIAMYYAMEHSLDAKIVRNYVAHLAGSDYGTLEGLGSLHAHSEPRKAMLTMFEDNAPFAAIASTDFRLRERRFWDTHAEIVKRMKTAGLLR